MKMKEKISEQDLLNRNGHVKDYVQKADTTPDFKLFSKRLVRLLSIVVAVMLLFSGCGENVEKEDDITTNGYINEEIPDEDSEFSDEEFLEDSNESDDFEDEYEDTTVEDGIVNLKGYDPSVGYYTEYVKEDGDASKKRLILWRGTGKEIKKIKQTDTVVIYKPYDSLTFLEVNVKPKYIVPLNFASSLFSFTDFPKSLNGLDPSVGTYTNDNLDSEVFDGLLRPGNPLTECNETPIEDFVNDNSCYYAGSMGKDYRFIVSSEKNKEFEFGGYIGTKWKSFNLYANVELYAPEKQAWEVTTTKTKKGYFEVDIVNLEKGIYHVRELNEFFEIV